MRVYFSIIAITLSMKIWIWCAIILSRCNGLKIPRRLSYVPVQVRPSALCLPLTPLNWVNYHNQDKLSENKRKQTVLVCFGMLMSPICPHTCLDKCRPLSARGGWWWGTIKAGALPGRPGKGKVQVPLPPSRLFKLPIPELPYTGGFWDIWGTIWLMVYPASFYWMRE